MIRTLTLSTVALVAATSFASAQNIFVDLAMQDDDRAAVRALTNTSVDGASFSTKGSGVAAGIFADLAAQDDDRAAVRALGQTSVGGDSYSTKGTSISALEVALRHAEENDERALAAHLRAQLGR